MRLSDFLLEEALTDDPHASSESVRIIHGSNVAPRYTEDYIAIGTGALGQLGAGYVPSNLGSIAIGYNALSLATTGDDNVALGHYAMQNVTTQNLNTAIGARALRAATTGVGANTAVGADAGLAITTGFRNTLIGYVCGVRITTGHSIVAIGGTDTLSMETTGSGHVAIGARAMAEAAAGLDNVAIGNEALFSNIHSQQVVDGSFQTVGLPRWTVNDAVPGTINNGWAAGVDKILKNADGTGVLKPVLDSGGVSVAYIDFGAGAHYSVRFTIADYTAGDVAVEFGGVALTGSPFNANGAYIVTVQPTAYDGTLATTLKFTPSNLSRFSLTGVQVIGTSNANASQNVAIGTGALYMTTLFGGATGDLNVGIGAHAGRQHTNGRQNVYIGAYSGKFNGPGNQNTMVGASAGQTANSTSRCVFLGFEAGFWETASDTLMIDNRQRTNQADARIKALVYGTFAATSAAQRFRINGRLGVTEVPVYANNAAAVAGGLAVGEFYRTGADPDPVCVVH